MEKSAFLHDVLKDRFIAEFNSLPMWLTLEAAYTAAPRRYHTLNHISAMLQHFDRLPPQKHARAILCAIWFHDLVYDTSAQGYGNNEALSAQAMVHLIRAHAAHYVTIQESGQSVLSLAAEMILATKGHLAASPYFENCPSALAACHLFLDLDLSILAQPAAVADAFDAGVRHEFSQYGDTEFARGRVAALSHFLARDRIFFSAQWREYEGAARATLMRLISHWSALANTTHQSTCASKRGVTP
jgi:predicted metal-dependent HD superfamily phosphohydrolase